MQNFWTGRSVSGLVAGCVVMALIVAGCASAEPELVRATVQNAPEITTTATPITEAVPPATIAAQVPTTVDVTTTQPASVPTTAVAVGSPTTVFATTNLFNETSLDTFPSVTGEWTDRDFAMVVAGSNREFIRQSATGRSDLERLKIWGTDELADVTVKRVQENAARGIEFRPGSIDDFIVYYVGRGDPEMVIVSVCRRNNFAEYSIGVVGDPSDDKLVQDTLAIGHFQRSLVKRGEVWKVANTLELEASKCDEFF